LGLGATVAYIPVTIVAGYNDTNFGVRASLDIVFSGLDAYGRIPFDEAGSSVYMGGGLGFNLTAFFVNAALASETYIPVTAKGLLGLEYRVENVGFFLEYAPTFVLSGEQSLNNLIGAFHAALGLNYHF
jgi:hypothetical protein